MGGLSRGFEEIQLFPSPTKKRWAEAMGHGVKLGLPTTPVHPILEERSKSDYGHSVAKEAAEELLRESKYLVKERLGGAFVVQ